MKKFLMLCILFFSVNAVANEVIWECTKYSMDRLGKNGSVSTNTFTADAKNTVVANDEGYYIPAGDTFNKEKYYYWLDDNPDGKAVNGKMALVKDQNRFIIYLFREDYKGQKGNDVVGYIAFTDCKISN